MNYNPENTSIAVLCGGNVGTQFACVCASKGYKVNVFSSKPELFDGILETVDEFENVTKGKINKVSNDIKTVIDGCQIIFVTIPAYGHKIIADQILPYVNSNTIICVVPGTGGAEFSFRECIKAGAVLSGIQRVPTVARLEKYGKRVRCEGLRPELFLASIPNSKSNEIANLMSELWDIPCKVLPNYLSVTLTPSNPILHTARLRTLFADYKDGKVYNNNPLFYGDWDDNSSKLLMLLDGELQDMLKIMDKLDLRYVISLKIHYESEDTEAMTRKISSIHSLHNLPSPMVQTNNGWIPDFNSRFFTADFPFGLAIFEELANILKYDAKNIKETMDWYRKITGNTKELDLNEYGIKTLEDIYEFYSTHE